jgi:putative tryptophan/tyrosine transport system substrate-binding protein
MSFQEDRGSGRASETTTPMRRRDFMLFLGSGIAAWPLMVRAQFGESVKRIGVLIGLAESDPVAQARVVSLREGLQRLGWTDGANIRIEFRFAAGEAARFQSSAAQLVALKPDVILAVTTPAVEAVRRETPTIPIVFVSVVDPVQQGLVDSLARPGGNITGFTNFEPSMGGKWLGVLKEIAPDVARVALMFNPETSAYAELFFRSVLAAAPSLRVKDVIKTPVRDASEIVTGISALGEIAGTGLVVLPDNLALRHRELIITQVAKTRIAAAYPFRSFASDGGLLVYGIDQNDTFRRATLYIDRILKGAKPADLPIQAPNKFELIINLRTARTLGFTVSPALLAIANEVIE